MFENRIISHSVYGTGTVTAFYPQTRVIWISFVDQNPKLYHIPEDFDSGVLSTEDAEINEYITAFKNSVRYRLQYSRTWKTRSKNKDVMKFFRESCEILDDLGIKYGKIRDVKIVNRNPRYFGCCVHLSDSEHQIQICRDCLEDDSTDADMYTLMLHELVHSCDGGIPHNKKYREYGDIIEKVYGYSITRDRRSLFYKPIHVAPVEGKKNNENTEQNKQEQY
ncbi:MAG: hypothetical protein IJM79_01210 [Erysipelotrichaceae bacterium]|nr:hypothetical protein [Erysipelotrichaceae bacterium]